MQLSLVARVKLNLPDVMGSTLVLENDGTVIDDVLFIPEFSKEPFLYLLPGEEWKSADSLSSSKFICVLLLS
jgi:hypothetical protein